MRILVTGGTAGQRVGELGLDSSTLPFELQCVLHLPQYPRHCLVLRVLVRLPRETCARLLRSELNQIDEGTRAGLSELRAIMDKRPSNHSGPHNARGVNSGTPVERDSELLKGIECSEEPRTPSSTVRWLPAVPTISGRPDKARSNVMLLRSMSLNVFSECEPKGTEISLPTMPSWFCGRRAKAQARK